MIEIRHDVFDIAWRIKSIDERYRLFYNRLAHRYEVYIGDEMQAVIPYNTLDVRAITYLRRTRRERIDALMREIEENNERIAHERDSEILERAMARVEEVF